MKKILPIGVSKFNKIIEGNLYFIDKSEIINDLIHDGSEVILLTRPRRFGKTLNMSMIKDFFEKTDKDKSSLFNNLKVWEDEETKNHFSKYPVIYISFKDEKYLKWQDCMKGFSILISNLYREHDYLLKSDLLSEIDKRNFYSVLEGTADVVEYGKSLNTLTYLLNKHYKNKTILLIDEYDVPIQSGYLNGYYEDVIGFMRNFLSGGLKDNVNLQKAVLTGVLRVAKESIFSGLNNLNVCTVLSKDYSRYFGFTEEEVKKMLEYYEIETKMEEIKKWYNGYIFGDNVIYNPWSIVNYVKKFDEGLKGYWANTSSNDLVKKLITEGNEELKEELQSLIRGETVEKYVNEDIVMNEVDLDAENIWSFLLFSGYLKPLKKERTSDGELKCWLAIPNIEVKVVYKDIILGWFKKNLGMDKYKNMLKALIQGDVDTFSDIFSDFILKSLSYFDISGEEPERVYHSFVLGMLVSLQDTHELKSNKESGYGRYDVMLIPREKKNLGIIIEFKKVNKRKKETLELAAKKALEQIEDRRYDVEMKDRGIFDTIKLGIAFEGKEILIVEG